jgi:hypothetical protein
VHLSLLSGLYPFEHGLLSQQDRQVRQGTPSLLRQAADCGCRVGLFSEAPEIFTGLDLGAPAASLPVSPADGVAAVQRWFAPSASTPRCLLLHYWSAHTPYGAADGAALGETARLLREGRVDVVRERYRLAVEEVFEQKLAPLLEPLDLSRWSVWIFGDHGESWTSDEFYHGTTVRNRVLRVPLWGHVPFQPVLPESQGLISLLDLYATGCGLLDLPRQDGGPGIDLRQPAPGGRRLWAGIRPGRDAGDDRLLEPGGQEPAPLRWCVFDEHRRLHGEAERCNLEEQWTERPVDGEAERAASYVEARRRLLASDWVQRPLKEGRGDEDLLRRRLRALGYL